MRDKRDHYKAKTSRGCTVKGLSRRKVQSIGVDLYVRRVGVTLISRI